MQDLEVDCVPHLMASCGQVLMEIYLVRLHNVYYYFLSAGISLFEPIRSMTGRLCFRVASCGQVLMEISLVRLHNVTHFLVNYRIDQAAGKELQEEYRKLNGCRIGDAKITSGTIIEMNITGTLPPTGNLKPNLKASPSLFTHAKSAQSVIHDVNTRDVTTRSISYIHFNGYNTYLLFLKI